MVLHWLLASVGVVIFVGAQQCSRHQELFASMLAALFASPIVTAVRLVFRWAMLQGELHRLYGLNDRERRSPTQTRSSGCRQLGAAASDELDRRISGRLGAPRQLRTTVCSRLVEATT